MKLIEIYSAILNENYSSFKKVGVIPYIIDNGKLELMFFVSSDSIYGGYKPQIAKGHIDSGENIKTAAFREAKEELGLIESNVKNSKKIVIKNVKGETSIYDLIIYAVEIKDKKRFVTPGHETKEIKWISEKNISTIVRNDQIYIVNQVIELIKNRN